MEKKTTHERDPIYIMHQSILKRSLSNLEAKSSRTKSLCTDTSFARRNPNKSFGIDWLMSDDPIDGVIKKSRRLVKGMQVALQITPVRVIAGDG
ncbi:hypothetical protein CEXT_485721 [Caerostris extrusa]|uniref:Uncharacterized protein n=1 Tax=Caerostris extrusa TaxID=172846 RepID=A0AAV4W080_CAEEX|nr:hypothetical protein CEXT_485721 [Caerostris extrusa]